MPENWFNLCFSYSKELGLPVYMSDFFSEKLLEGHL